MFYVAPIKNIIGKTVKQGDVIATLQDIRKKYPNDPDMKLHCHVEVVSLDLEILRGF
jgi:hypothetical protein